MFDDDDGTMMTMMMHGLVGYKHTRRFELKLASNNKPIIESIIIPPFCHFTLSRFDFSRTIF
jgi:hypothetical protein